MGCNNWNCYDRVYVSIMRLALYTFFIILLFSTKSFSIINVKDYQNIFLKYNLSDEYNFNNISSICLEKHKDNNTRIYRNDKNEEILEINDEQGFLSCTYAEILEIIKPIPVVNSLQQKPLEKFILENEITITKGLNQEKFTFVFNDKEYIQYKNNKEILRDGWRWGKIGKPLRVFMNGEKTTWKVSVDQMALTIKVGKEKTVPYFLTFENKQEAKNRRINEENRILEERRLLEEKRIVKEKEEKRIIKDKKLTTELLEFNIDINKIETKLHKIISGCMNYLRIPLLLESETYKFTYLLSIGNDGSVPNYQLFQNQSLDLRGSNDFEKEIKTQLDVCVYEIPKNFLEKDFNINNYDFYLTYSFSVNSYNLTSTLSFTEDTLQEIIKNKKTYLDKVSTDMETKGFKIYENFPHNWTLFGIKLYDKIENLNIIGKITRNFDKDSCYEVKSLNGQKLIINQITDNKGCLISGSYDLFGTIGSLNYLVEPKNKNDLFSLYIISYSPLEERILSILARTGKSLGSQEVCANQGNLIIENIYDKLSKQINFRVHKYKKEYPRYFGSGNLIYYKVTLDYHPNNLGGDFKDLFADYNFQCENIDYDSVDETYLQLQLNDIYYGYKQDEERRIIEENKLQLKKNKTKDKFENTLQKGVF